MPPWRWQDRQSGLQRLAQPVQVPAHHGGLLLEGVAALVVAVVYRCARSNASRNWKAVVDGQAQDAMLSVLRTPWQKPTARHCATRAAVRSLTACNSAA